IKRYEYRIGGGSVKSLPSGKEITVPNDGTNYRIQVRACNTYCGAWSKSSNSFSTYGRPGSSSIDIKSSVNDKKVSFSWTNAGSDNGAKITGGRYRIDGGGWKNFSGTSGSTSVTGGWSEKHTIDVQLRNEHDQFSGSKSASATAEKKPAPPVSIGVDTGRQEVCSDGGVCYRVVMTYENLPKVSGGYDLSFQAGPSSGGCSMSRPDSDSGAAYSNQGISGDGRWEAPSWYGIGCDGETVTWTAVGGGKTYQGS